MNKTCNFGLIYCIDGAIKRQLSSKMSTRSLTPAGVSLNKCSSKRKHSVAVTVFPFKKAQLKFALVSIKSGPNSDKMFEVLNLHSP